MTFVILEDNHTQQQNITIYKKWINSAGQWIEVEKHPCYPEQLSYPAFSPNSLKEGNNWLL